MRFLRPVLFFFLPTLSWANAECYLFVLGDVGEKRSAIEQVVKPLISSFVTPIKDLPISGISDSELDSSCYFEILIISAGASLSLSIDNKRSPIPLRGFSKSMHSFPDNVRHATLRILHKKMPETKKDKICRNYGEVLLDECPQNQRMTLVFQQKRDSVQESLSREPRAILSAELESVFRNLGSIEFVGISKIRQGNSFLNSLGKIMSEMGANSSLVLTIDWEFQKQQTSLWKGLVSMTVSMESYLLKDGKLVKMGGYSIDTQSIPIRKWGESKSFKKKNLLRISKKITQKWSEEEIMEFIQSNET